MSEDGAQASVIAARSVSAEVWTGVTVVSSRSVSRRGLEGFMEHALLIRNKQCDGAAQVSINITEQNKKCSTSLPNAAGRE